MKTTATRRAAVWDLLRDGEWHATMEICAVDVGGSEGCRRLRELRKECRQGKRSPFRDILKRKSSWGTQYEYSLVKFGVKYPGGVQLGLPIPSKKNPPPVRSR